MPAAETLPPDYTIRVATLADVSTLVDHRVAMFTDMRTPIDAARVRQAFASWLATHLPAGTYRAWLVDAPDSTVAAGAGLSQPIWPPGPTNFSERLPFVYNVYTEPAHRRRGLARALMNAIHAWCRDAGYGAIGLAASADGRPLYESLGYGLSHSAYMFKAL